MGEGDDGGLITTPPRATPAKLPPPAAASGDDCAKCNRPIELKHLAVRQPGGQWEHFMCPDLPHPGPRAVAWSDARRAAAAAVLPDNLRAVAHEVARVSLLRTSELLRLAGRIIDVDSEALVAALHGLPVDVRAKAAAIANELRVRAVAIADAVEETHAGHPACDCPRCNVVREIGEVRS